MNSKSIRFTTLGLSVALFLVALTQKCYCTTSLCGDSILVLIFGFFGMFFGGAALCWVANPLLITSWILVKKSKTSLFLSLLSALIAMSFMLFDEVIDDEAGHYNRIIEYKVGYWLWVASHLTMFLGNLVIRKKEQTLG